MRNRMGNGNENENKGGGNGGRRQKTVEDGSEPSETDGVRVGRMGDRSDC